MHNTFELIIGNNANEQESILFNIFDNDIAQLWANEINSNYPLYEIDRFTHWPNSKKNELYFEHNLKTHVSIINNYDKIIKIDQFKSQDFLNQLHKHFEDMRGHVDYATDWYKNLPREIQLSVDRINILIHEYESFLAEKNQPFKNPTIVGTFSNRPTHRLDENHYQYFTHRWEFGTVYINYCEVGKPLLDVYKDQDEHIGPNAIRPQSTYSADFMIKFGPSVPQSYALQKERDFFAWYNLQNFNFKHLSLGMIPVAKIAHDIQIDKLEKYDRIINVSCN